MYSTIKERFKNVEMAMLLEETVVIWPLSCHLQNIYAQLKFMHACITFMDYPCNYAPL